MRPYDIAIIGQTHRFGPVEACLEKKPFTQPKLEFIEPKLTKHGDATKVTSQGFFGGFSP